MSLFSRKPKPPPVPAVSPVGVRLVSKDGTVIIPLDPVYRGLDEDEPPTTSGYYQHVWAVPLSYFWGEKLLKGELSMQMEVLPPYTSICVDIDKE